MNKKTTWLLPQSLMWLQESIFSCTYNIKILCVVSEVTYFGINHISNTLLRCTVMNFSLSGVHKASAISHIKCPSLISLHHSIREAYLEKVLTLYYAWVHWLAWYYKENYTSNTYKNSSVFYLLLLKTWAARYISKQCTCTMLICNLVECIVGKNMTPHYPFTKMSR